jgi:hypothetical protein
MESIQIERDTPIVIPYFAIPPILGEMLLEVGSSLRTEMIPKNLSILGESPGEKNNKRD